MLLLMLSKLQLPRPLLYHHVDALAHGLDQASVSMDIRSIHGHNATQDRLPFMHCQSTLLLSITKAVEAVVAVAECCKSEREKDLHGENFRTGVGGDADNSLLGDFDLLTCGGRGGKRGLCDNEFETRHSLLLLLSELLIIADKAKELLLELASLFDMPLLLFSKMRLLSQ